jgi:ferredoxin
VTSSAKRDSLRLEKKPFDALFHSLSSGGYRIIGPKIENNAIVYSEISASADLPKGWIDVQNGGSYRLEKSGEAYFGYVVGPSSPKQYLFSPEEKLWSAEMNGKNIDITAAEVIFPKTAFLGVRPCELAAIAIQDQIFTQGEYIDPVYGVRRHNTILIAVNCARAGGTCFCVSMGTGPKAESGFDIALTEIGGNDGYFIVESGSDRGEEILGPLSLEPASASDIKEAEAAVAAAAINMGRNLDATGLPDLLRSNLDDPRYPQVASRCLACGNCTLVCPTCFCSTVIDTTDLSGSRSERFRRWDSCFNLEHSYIHGGHVRTSILSRYRQWITHKLSSWVDQFGVSGCVGCGRCITWCPVGIDITEEAGIISQNAKENVEAKKG